MEIIIDIAITLGTQILRAKMKVFANGQISKRVQWSNLVIKLSIYLHLILFLCIFPINVHTFCNSTSVFDTIFSTNKTVMAFFENVSRNICSKYFLHSLGKTACSNVTL